MSEQGVVDNSRVVAVIADGRSDIALIQEIVRVILNSGKHTVLSLERQSLRDSVDRFWRNANASDDRVGSTASERLGNEVVNVLTGALSDLELEMERKASSGDLIILSSDAERYLSSIDRFFDPWASALWSAIQLGIQRFYQVMTRAGHSQENLPLVVPFIPFPSSDIVVRAAKSVEELGSVRSKGARELKRELYSVDDLRFLSADEFQEKALRHISVRSLGDVYREIIEIRQLFQILSLASQCS